MIESVVDGISVIMATKYGLAVSSAFVKGTAGPSLESMRRNYTKDKLIDVACSLGWLVRDTMGVDTFRACLNLVESSPACGGGLERLAKAYRLNRLGPYRDKALNAAKITSEDFVTHMANFGLDTYGEPLPRVGGGGDEEEEAAAAAAALAASSQCRLHTQQHQQHQQGDSVLISQEDLPVMSLFDPDKTPAIPSGQGGDGGDDGKGKVSAPIANDDPDCVGDVDDPHHVSDVGNVRAPAATDPLLAGGTLGRVADQSQAQARTQVQGPAVTKKLCKSIWRDDVCTNKECERAHPARCGDPRCFPLRWKECQHWHRAPGQVRTQHSQGHSQGNGRSVDPGSAGLKKAQGEGRRKRQQQQQSPPLQQQQKRGQRQGQQGRQQQPQRQQQRLHQRGALAPRPPPPGPRLLPPPPLQVPHQWRTWNGPLWQPPWGLSVGEWPLLQQQQQQQQQHHSGGPTYRDVLKGGNGGGPGPASGHHSQLLQRLAALEQRLAGLNLNF